MVEYTKVSVSQEIKDRLDEEQGDDETRNEQMERLLSAAEGGDDESESPEVYGSPKLEEVHERVVELQNQLDRMPTRVVEELPR